MTYPMLVISREIEEVLEKLGEMNFSRVGVEDLDSLKEGHWPVVLSNFVNFQGRVRDIINFIVDYPGDFILLSSRDVIPSILLPYFITIQKDPLRVWNEQENREIRIVPNLLDILTHRPSFYPTYRKIKDSDLPRKRKIMDLLLEGKKDVKEKGSVV